MKFGVMMFPTDYSMSPHELAIAVEERGLNLYGFQSIHIFRYLGYRRGWEEVSYQRCITMLWTLLFLLVQLHQ